MKGKCRVCGKEDAILVNGMCPDCLTLSMYIESDLDDKDEELNTENNEEEDEANAPREKQIEIGVKELASMAKLSDLAKRNEMILKNAGITPRDRMIFKDDFNRLYCKYREQIRNKEYRIAKATFVGNVSSEDIIDTSRGLVVVKASAIK